MRLARLATLAPWALCSLASAACSKGLGASDPVPDTNYCSADAARAACLQDAQRAGSYPAIDALAAEFATANGALGCAYGVSLDGQIL